jgi:hypothetical protein
VVEGLEKVLEEWAVERAEHATERVVQTVVEAISWVVSKADGRDAFAVMAGCLVKHLVVEKAIDLLVALTLLLLPIPLVSLVPLAVALALVLLLALSVVLGNAPKVLVQAHPTMV